MDINTGVRYIKGVGEAREKLMNKLGIHTLYDLVSFFPRTYEDRTKFKNIADLIIGETVCVRAIAASAPQLSHVRQGLDYIKFQVVDETGTLDLTFFNQSYLKDTIIQGEIYVFYGKVGGSLLLPSMVNPLIERNDASGVTTGRLIPIYPLTSGLTQKSVMSAIRTGLDKCGDELPDVLSEDIVSHFELCGARFAYENIHFPVDEKALELARHRLIFEELFILSAAMKHLRSRRDEKKGKMIKGYDFNDFYRCLPFSPTNAQKQAIVEASNDMSMSRPMNRLVQGDVGSGKTLVAAACCWNAWRGGHQSAFMAPTEILAKQHYSSLISLLEPFGIRIGLLTGSMTTKQKKEVNSKIIQGDIDLIIGTHALISDSVQFSDLALVVTDEQHRFGVNQRSMLSEKGDSPHVLVMSATPIPRTLALIIYGDLDVSVIDEMPPGRKEVKTYVVDESYRPRIYRFIQKLVEEGRQVYIICSMVDDMSDDKESELPGELKSAQTHFETLNNDIFPDLRIALVHGKMKTKEKDAVMTSFARGETDILVATTVVEVGVDVANAALMVVENAERFGLSQLHQLRGRVGRGEYDSYCVLFQGANSSVSTERLNIMRDTNDGFKIAEEDLKLRGPGDFFGSRQHGLPELRIADFAADLATLYQAQNSANEILQTDPSLTKPENRKLAEQIMRLFNLNSDMMN